MAEARHTNRGLVRYRPRWLHPNPEECFWLCVDAGWQAVIALSSGEAEYNGLVRATSQMLGLQSMLLDWGWMFNAHVWMDATAGIVIGSRRRETAELLFFCFFFFFFFLKKKKKKKRKEDLVVSFQFFRFDFSASCFSFDYF